MHGTAWVTTKKDEQGRVIEQKCGCGKCDEYSWFTPDAAAKDSLDRRKGARPDTVTADDKATPAQDTWVEVAK